MLRIALLLDEADNVASALADLVAGTVVPVESPGGRSLKVTLRQNVALGHKFALDDIAQGQAVIKHGIPIGWATRNIRQGEHIHVHNLA